MWAGRPRQRDGVWMQPFGQILTLFPGLCGPNPGRLDLRQLFC